MGLCPTMAPSTPFVHRPSFACRINQLPARENWPCLADKEGLAAYFGHDFNRNALPGTREIEAVDKADVLDGLKNATRRCKKGQYGKGRHSFDILEQTDPTKVFDASLHARRLIETLREKAT